VERKEEEMTNIEIHNQIVQTNILLSQTNLLLLTGFIAVFIFISLILSLLLSRMK